jgi:hypothetical protein
MVESYFDESGSDEGSPVLCVAGYIIEKSAAIVLESEWGQMLERFGLPFFRMSSCAHGTKPFKMLTKDERIACATEAISVIRKQITFGIAITVEPKRYQAIIPNSPEAGSAYSMCAHTCLTAVKTWAAQNNYFGGVSYFFESGHRSQSEANQIMNRIFKIPALRKSHRYVAHIFADKKLVKSLQAADLIAWQWYTDHKRRMAGALRPRKDTEALMAPFDGESKSRFHMLHFDDLKLKGLADTLYKGNYPLTYPGSQWL